MVVHVRDAWPEVLRVLDEGSAARDPLLQRRRRDRSRVRRARLLDQLRGITYPKNEHLRGKRRAVDIDRILVETDRAVRSADPPGTDNEPANVIHTIAEVARIRDEDVRSVAEATSRNADAAFFGLVLGRTHVRRSRLQCES